MKKVEYKIRPVTKFNVTRYECDADGKNGVSSIIGQYENGGTAYEVGYAMCKNEHQISGEPTGSMNFIYPSAPKGAVIDVNPRIY